MQKKYSSQELTVISLVDLIEREKESY